MKSLRPLLHAVCSALLIPAAAAAQRSRGDTVPRTRSLPGLVAEAERETCARNDDPAARALWQRMRRHYAQLDSATLSATMHASADYVEANRLLQFDTARSNHADGTTDGWNTSEVLRDEQQRGLAFYQAPRVGMGSRGMAGRLRAALARGILRNGYATLNTGVSADLTQASSTWSYPPLDGELASHFADELFGGLTLFAMKRGEASPALTFCTAARYRSRPYLSGTLFLAADSSLARVEWHFHTPEPREDAGGEVRFYPPAADAQAPLSAREGAFYRRHLRNQFYHRQLVYRPWRVSEALVLADSLIPVPPPRIPMQVTIPRRTRRRGQ